jgi:hypothetical protein
MGNNSSVGAAEGGVGRLVMRGKTCEVKVAEPKEKGRAQRGGPAGKTIRQGYYDNHNHQQFAHAQPPPVVFHPEAMGMAYPAQYQYYSQEAVATSPMHIHMMHPYPYYAGYGYMTPMYYPPGAPPIPPMMPPAVGEYEYAGAVPPPYPMGPYSYAMDPMEQAIAAPAYYPSPTTTSTYPQQANGYACIPLMATPVPAPAPLAPAYPQQTSVMQPVAPGIPVKDDDHEAAAEENEERA